MGIFGSPFAYNTGGPISGTTQYGDLVIGNIEVDYSSDYGGVKWWASPEEITGYVIGNARPTGQPVPSGVTGTAQVGFWRSKGRTDQAFLDLANYIGSKNGQPPFATTNDAEIWLESNGYYTSFNLPTPTPTSTMAPTPTPTPTITQTPTNTQTLTQTPTPSITTSQTSTPTPSITASQTVTPTVTQTPTNTPTQTLTSTPTRTPTPSGFPSGSGTFSQAFTGGSAPSVEIETAWNTFRSTLTGTTYTQFVWSSTNGNTLTVTHPTLVQTLANGLRTATSTNVTINSVTWLVGLGCGTPKIGGVAVELSNIGSCSPSSTYALRPMINNANWGGTNESTIGAPSQE